MQAKSNNSSFSHSGDMVGAHQNLNGSRDLTTPLSGIVCHLLARTCYAYYTINLSTKRKAIQNVENEVVWGSVRITGRTGDSPTAVVDRM